MSNFTQPICAPCWLFANAYHGEVREPVRMTKSEPRICSNCGAETTDGIFIRIDPVYLRHPAMQESSND